MRRMNTTHARNERTWDHRALASPALVTSACVSLVHVSVPSLPQRLAAAWGWSSPWSQAGHCTVIKVFWPGETMLPGFQQASPVPRTDFQRVYPRGLWWC